MRLLPLVVLISISCSREDASAPVALPTVQAPSGGVVSGRVLETFEAPGYTYLLLSTRAGDRWAAIPTAAVAVGSEVRLANPMPMKNFVSKTLGRTFAEILFASGIEQKGGAASAPQRSAGLDPEYAALDAWAKTAAAPVPRAAGVESKTVAEIFAQRAELADKPVMLRGKVVKVTSGVLGKNWLHLRDGSGSPEGKDDDLVVTTAEKIAIGDVVVMRGPVHLARDFGSGYVFPVMIEDAQLVR